jgi:trimeric autotransporter adhesin
MRNFTLRCSGKWQKPSKKTALLLVALLTMGIVNAQFFTVGQCSGTPSGGLGTNVYGPMYSTATANSASRTAIIYPASQLSGISGQVLTSLYFYRFTTTGTMAGTPAYKIYIKEVSASDWTASNLDWATAITGAALVYDGNPASIVGSVNGWKNFPFASNFTYSGSQNLAVFTEYVNTTASTNLTWTYEYTGSCINTGNSNTTKYVNTTDGIPGAALSSSNYRRPYIGFDVFLTCYPPTSVTVPPASITVDRADVSWTAPASAPANGYEYYYNTTGVSPVPATPVSGSTAAGVTTANLAGLASGTLHYFWVRSVCSGSDKSPWTSVTTFNTLPGNDEASTAIGLTVNADYNCGTTRLGSTIGATQSSDVAPSCSATGINDDVWYSFVATGANHRISFSGVSTGTMVAAVYTGTPGSLTQVASACASTTLNATGLSAGQTYYIRAYTSVVTATTMANFTICVGTPPPPPANDNAAGAIALTVNSDLACGTTTTGTTVSATQSPDAAPTCSATGIDDDVWFTFVATGASHRIIFSGVSTGTMVSALYTGTPGSLTFLTAACASTTLNATGLVSGTTYYVRAYNTATTSATQSNFTICIGTPPPPPANDECAAAIALTVNTDLACGTVTAGTTTSATGVADATCTGTEDDDVWFKFTATGATHQISLLNVAGSVTDMAFQVFNGCGGTSLLCSDPNSASLSSLTPGNTYYVRVYTYTSTAGQNTTFNVCIGTPPPPPANDEAPGAITLSVGAGCTTNPYDNTVATQSTTEPFPSCKGTAGYAGMWYKFVAPASGAVKVSCDGTGTLGDSRISLFAATNVSDYATFTNIACDDDNGVTGTTRSLLYATGLTSGTTYYVLVDLYSSTATRGTYCVTADELSSAMLTTTAGSCVTDQASVASYNAAYTGWITLLDAAGNLNALVRQTAGTATGFGSSRTITTGPSRVDASGTAYLNRNFLINGSGATTAEVQLFFTDAELASLGGTLAGLNVSRVAGTTCVANYPGGATLLGQTGSGSGGGVSWVKVTTPGFSNFFLHQGNAALPISLVYFNGTKSATANNLNWKVNCTSVSVSFEIERSSNGRNFTSIGALNATQARCLTPFDFADSKPLSGVNYYRIKIIDVDGKVNYTNIVAINNKKSGIELIGIQPTLVNSEAVLYIAAAKAGKLQIAVTDNVGRQVQTRTITVVEGDNKVSLNFGNLAAGVYNLCSINESTKSTIRFVKQ